MVAFYDLAVSINQIISLSKVCDWENDSSSSTDYIWSLCVFDDVHKEKQNRTSIYIKGMLSWEMFERRHVRAGICHIKVTFCV